MSLLSTILGLSLAASVAPSPCMAGDSLAPSTITLHESPAPTPASDPFVLVGTERRRNCSSGSFHVTLRNTDDEPRDIRICLAQHDATWDCGMIYGVDPRETASYWKCSNRATGRYWWVSRPSSSSERLPHPPA